MATTLLPDPLHSASHAAMAAHLSGPFAGGARVTKLDIDAHGEAHVDWNARLPLLVIAPRFDVGETSLTGTVTITQTSGEVIAPVTVVFAPYTEAGGSVLAYRPGPLSMVLECATPFTVILGAAVEDSSPASLFDLYVIEGNLGRMMYVIGAEKMRLRRQAAELYAARRLVAATGRALDRFGSDLGVPRFDTELVWDPVLQVPTIAPHPESDAAYRARLAIYRRYLRPSRSAVELLVNGPGAATDPNRGLPAATGLTPRVKIEEPDTDLVIAMRLVSAPDDTQRLQYLAYLRDAVLLAPGTPVPTTRLVPSDIKTAENALRTRIAATFAWPQGANIAPELARVLDRVGECRKALGVTRPWKVLRAQDDAGGSRYELGLGVDLEVPPAGELDGMAAKLASKTIAPGTPADIRALVSAMSPVPEAQDAMGQWLLGPCGIQTVHSLDAGKTYVSHLVCHGLVIGKTLTAGRTLLDARWNAPRDSGPDIVLVLALGEVDAVRASAGIPPWTLLTGATERAAWSAAVAPGAPLVAAMSDAALHMESTAADVTAETQALAAVPSELVLTLQLDATFAASLIAHDATATQKLRQLVVAFQTSGVTSLLPLVTNDGRVLLIAGAVALPGDATLLTARWKSTLRWYVVPIAGDPGSLAAKIGSRNEWMPASGLSAVVAIAPGRRGTADPRGRVAPLELRMSLPDGSLIALEQYEFLMNLFERTHPLGVVVDTRAIRTHIDANGDHSPEPLTNTLSRTFRAFHVPRRIGTEET